MASPTPVPLANATTPISITCDWANVFTDLSAKDNTGLVDQASDVSAATITARTFYADTGTLIVPRLGYAVATTAITTNAVIVLWGRVRGTSNDWQVMRNKAGGVSSTLTANIGTASGSDVKGSTYAYTTPDIDSQAWDRQGCNEFFPIILTNFDGDSTDATTVLQVKVI